jgi:hypothetical protein
VIIMGEEISLEKVLRATTISLDVLVELAQALTGEKPELREKYRNYIGEQDEPMSKYSASGNADVRYPKDKPPINMNGELVVKLKGMLGGTKVIEYHYLSSFMSSEKDAGKSWNFKKIDNNDSFVKAYVTLIRKYEANPLPRKS